MNARLRIFVVLVLALGAGGALAYGTYAYMQNMPVKTVGVPTQTVVVSASDLSIGTEIRAEDVRVVEWPSSTIPKGVFSSASDVVGRGVIMPVVENEPILALKLAAKDGGVGLPPAIPNGMRALSVRVNEVIGVAGYVLPGTRVDVLATANPTDTRGDVTSKLVLTNVQVLAAGTKMEQDTERGKPVAVSVVTMLVTPEQSERLTLASTEGKIQLALRNPLDRSAPSTPGIKPAALLGTSSGHARPVVRLAMARQTVAPPPAPVAPVPEPAPSVEVIRGDKRAVEVIR